MAVAVLRLCKLGLIMHIEKSVRESLPRVGGGGTACRDGGAVGD